MGIWGRQGKGRRTQREKDEMGKGNSNAEEKKEVGNKKNKIQVSTQEMQEFGQKMVGLCTVQEKN